MNANPPTDPPPQGGEKEQHEEVFLYKDSGIREQTGHVPLWLWVVVVVMVLWGIYYTVAYWTPPGG